MFRKATTSFVVTEKELLASFREQVLIVGDMRTTVGRPKLSVIGAERKQVDINVGEKIIEAMLAEITGRGGKLEPKIATLYYARGQRQWAGQKLSAMAQMNPSATGGNAVERLWNALKDLIIIGRDQNGHNIYHPAKSATRAELHSFIDLMRGRAVKQSVRSNLSLTLLRAGLEDVGDRTLEAAYAEECERYRLKADQVA